MFAACWGSCCQFCLFGPGLVSGVASVFRAPGPVSTRDRARAFTNPVFICLARYGRAQQAQFGIVQQAQMLGYVQQPLAGDVVADQIPGVQSMPLQNGPVQQRFSSQPGLFMRQQGLPQLSGPGVVQSSAAQGAALNLHATAFQPISVN